jgi:hypothetical protein
MEPETTTMDAVAGQEVRDQAAEAPEAEEQMCCDGSGRTAEQHRAESPDHKCCVDG